MVSSSDGKDNVVMSETETVMMAIYAEIDTVVADELAALKADGITPTCGKGCGSCCRHFVVISAPEAEVLAAHVRRTYNAEQQQALRKRTKAWHAWDTLLRTGDNSGHHDACCPFLIDESCSVYSVRPSICRSHHAISSCPEACLPSHDPRSLQKPVRKLVTVMDAVRPLNVKIDAVVTKQGGDPDRDVLLLPQALAVQMGWDCAIDIS